MEVYRRIARKGEMVDGLAVFYPQIDGQEVEFRSTDPRFVDYDDMFGELLTKEYLGHP